MINIIGENENTRCGFLLLFLLIFYSFLLLFFCQATNFEHKKCQNLFALRSVFFWNNLKLLLNDNMLLLHR